MSKDHRPACGQCLVLLGSHLQSCVRHVRPMRGCCCRWRCYPRPGGHRTCSTCHLGSGRSHICIAVRQLLSAACTCCMHKAELLCMRRASRHVNNEHAQPGSRASRCKLNACSPVVDNNISNDLDIVLVALVNQLTQVCLTAIAAVQLVQVTRQVALHRTSRSHGCAQQHTRQPHQRMVV